METYLTGRIKFFDRTKGFGFIICDGSDKEYFFHISRLVNPMEVPVKGDKFSFDIGENRNGDCAINVERI